MRNALRLFAIFTVACVVATPSFAGEMTAQAAFDQLKALEGTWEGVPEGEGHEEEVSGKAIHEIEISAAGTVVQETMAPGTPHEMINMYHLDGEDLVLTHYCAGGNQPTMRLDRAASSAEKFVFRFAGGTNLDPLKDPHIHSAQITFEGENKMESAWFGYQGGEPAGTMTFHLARGE